MEKQAVSNTETKFNKTTTFLSKMIFRENFDMLKKVGFVDSYTSDPEVMKILTLEENQRMLFLLFRNKKLTVEDIKKIVLDLSSANVKIVFCYELINDYSMVAVEFPEEHVKDYDFFVKGMYSKLSSEFKEKFPETRDVFNDKKVRIGKEYTIYYHIFNRTDWLKNFWMNKLGLMELDEKLELWGKPEDEDIIFNINKTVN